MQQRPMEGVSTKQPARMTLPRPPAGSGGFALRVSIVRTGVHTLFSSASLPSACCTHTGQVLPCTLVPVLLSSITPRPNLLPDSLVFVAPANDCFRPCSIRVTASYEDANEDLRPTRMFHRVVLFFADTTAIRPCPTNRSISFHVLDS